jgi:protein phosphatase 1 regulatory subunit 10
VDASLPDAETASLAAEFKITTREVLAVVEHFRSAHVSPASNAPPVSPGKRAAVVDDDDDSTTFTTKHGISDEVRAQVCCGALHATLVLPKGYSKLQEYVIYADGSKVTPATLERDAGKGASKNWKFTVRVVGPDGSAGRVLKKWLDDTGYHPKGFDPSAAPKKRDGATKKAKAKAKKEKEAKARETEIAKEKKPEENSSPKPATVKTPSATTTLFEQQLDNFLDDDGGVNLETNVPKVVWMMKNVMTNAEKSLVIRVLHRTKLVYLKSFVQGDGLEVMKKWFELAKGEHKSSLLLKMLLTLERMPVSVAALKETGWGKAVVKLQKYAPPAKDNDAKKSSKENQAAQLTHVEFTRRVKDAAQTVKGRWERLVLMESEALDVAEREEKLANALKSERWKAAAAAAASGGVKREAAFRVPAAAAPNAKRVKTDQSKPAVATKIVAKVVRPTTTTTIVKQAGLAKPTGLSFGGINIRGTKAAPERPAGLVKAQGGGSATATAPKPGSPPPAPMVFKKKPSVRAGFGVTWPDSHDSLETAKFFYKSDPPAACNPDPDVVARLVLVSERKPSRWDVAKEAEREADKDEEEDEEEDEKDEAAVAKARERQQRELAAESRAAALTRQRRLNEMKAKIKWRPPRKVPYGEDVEIGKGEESFEAGRLREIARRTKEVVHTNGLVPDSPAEAPPGAALGADITNVVEIPLLHKMTPEQQRQQEQQQRLMQQQRQQHGMAPHLQPRGPLGGPPLPPGAPPPGFGPPPSAPPGLVDADALQALLNSMQSNPALMANLGAAGARNGGQIGPRPGAGNQCAFFNSPNGCHRGDQCKFEHTRGAPPGPQAFPFMKRQG